jgi:hypothetical protein
VPAMPVTRAKRRAPRLLISPRTSGRFLVLLIFASCSGSSIMFRAFADALVRKVPVVRNASVIVLSEGVEVTVVLRRDGTG